MQFDNQKGIDDNDTDEFGFDRPARKRMGLKAKKLKKRFKAPIRPNIPGHLRYEESTLRQRSYITHRTDKDMTLAVFKDYLYSVKPFIRSMVGSIEKQGNGYVAQGAWPSSGKHILDWELAVTKEGRDFIVDVGIWDVKGKQLGDKFRVTQSNHATFLKKRFHLYIDEMFRLAKQRIRRQ